MTIPWAHPGKNRGGGGDDSTSTSQLNEKPYQTLHYVTLPCLWQEIDDNGKSYK